MNMLSIGMPSNLKSYKTLCDLFFGPESVQASFISKKISQSPNGEDEEVIADESQVLYLLQSMNQHEQTPLEQLL